MEINNLEEQHRVLLTKAKRIVVKVGTRILVDKNGKPNHSSITAITEQLAKLKKSGHEVLLVTSGAVGAGMQILGCKKRPTAIQDLQMAAAIGQVSLMNYYTACFTKWHCKIGQVLLTHADLKSRERHLNARNTILNLLQHGIIPVINENDVVSCDEIKIGDNDVLSALVTTLIDADLLIILTTPNGLRKPLKSGKTERVGYLPKIDKGALELVSSGKDQFGTGGMGSKLQAAQIAALTGALVVIASGKDHSVIKKVLQGAEVGTLIGNPKAANVICHRKRWIAFFHKPQGKLIIDQGAAHALLEEGKSLLPIGVCEVEGKFSAGTVVNIFAPTGENIGRGLIEYNIKEMQQIKGKPSTEIAKILGYKNSDTVIHRDNMVLFG